MSLFTPNTSKFNSYYDKAKFLLAWRISLVFTICFSILVPVFSVSNSNAILPGASALFVAGSCLIYLYITKNFSPLYWIYSITGTIIVHFAINTVLEFTHFVDFMWICAIILLAYIGLGKKLGLLFVGIHLLGITYFIFFSLNNHIETLSPRNTNELLGAILEIILAMIAISYLLTQYIDFKEHSENQLLKINTELSNKNHENIVLVKEIHHRVKNNLQIIISLLRLQKGELKSDEAKKHFSEAINRIMVMSLIHKKLYQEKELSHINIQTYLIDLAEDIQSISDLGFPININVTSEIENVGLKTIVPLGLLINELLTNSIKHAFFKKEKGLINVIIKKKEGYSFLLDFSDNGKWVEPNSQNPSFGLELIGILTSQLEGDYKKESNEDGTTFSFELKNIDLEK